MAKASGGPASSPLKRSYRGEGGALTRGFGVQQGTAEDQAKVSGAATKVLGVVDESTAAAGDPVGVVLFGECIAIAGGLVTAGMPLKTDANGKFVDASAADVETGGKALTGAAADGDEFVMFVNPNHKRS
jgi:hypothetical protein